MKAIYNNSQILDQNAINNGLNEDILLENAGISLAKLIKKEQKKFNKAKVLFLLGGGNNACDALVAIRHLKKCKAFKLEFRENENFKKQSRILGNYGFKFLKKEPNFNKFDIIVDAVFGSGFKGKLNTKTIEIFQKVNSSKALKIACDIPSGLGMEFCFKADITLCMGALKEILLEDFAKEFIGKIKIANLGISNKKFIKDPQGFLLKEKDLNIIKRKVNSNKANFGHIYIAGNESAGTLAALGALNFGAGLVSLVAKKTFSPLIMLKDKIEPKANVAALGMGLNNLDILKDNILDNIPLVLDANCFLSENILNFLQRKDVILTPHPKEFSRLLKFCFKEDISTSVIQKNRFFYARKFTNTFECVLLLKGANPIIMQKDQLFVVNLGNANLAKGGSGDVLSGMIAALLGANFSPLDAAKNACLAHALVAKKYKFNQNSFDALKLIKGLKCI
ncbi:carbohydrate kinase, YjeF-related protein [Campylobacter novaezeelandiae]|uniref:Bifunctional NAD(P)H-hydrate repair enzyme n=1 Tax=Campylobacter novaezeelandiae TaxID=2267891 RepID=A0A4Q9JWA6_9BACT|nr:NAD(P)H-hydrate dehydratase [Campylobacter novaezeelandiae]QWU80051.1 carbohydrate kinase, YjeF-related protein [Campylobacter novaezeelandiae]TBR82375.1 NAD(P)H-hydrate dehydratase [Campylobacter novaezeelandiae]